MPNKHPEKPTVSRRTFLQGVGQSMLVISASGWHWSCGGAQETSSDDASNLEGCATLPDVEGPFYTPDAPMRSALAEVGEAGERIQVVGQIVDAEDCATPLPGYVLDLWHADDSGAYDNAGFKLRGKFVADGEGRFVVETILPGRYPSRPVRHIHVKIRDASGGERLTTQIYFEQDLSSAFPGPRAVLNDGVANVTFVVSRA